MMDLKKHLFALLSPLLTMWAPSDDSESIKSNVLTAPWIPAPLPVCLELQVRTVGNKIFKVKKKIS